MSKIHKSTIIVPVDFTEESDTAINHAMRIAIDAHNDIRLLHIVNSETKSRLKKEGKDLSDLEKQLQGLCDRIEESDVDASYSLREGSIFSAIGDVAEEIKAGLMVLGTHGVRGVQHIVGAYALKVVSDSPVPVIVVQNKGIPDHAYKKIVIPIESYPEEKQKVFHVISIAKVFGSKVELFAAHSTDKFIKNGIEGNLVFMEDQLESAEVEYSTHFEDPKGPGYARQLVRFAAEIDADLITIITEKGKDLADFILGPNNEKIINNDAQIPVMCVNPMDSHVYTRSVFTM